MKFVNRAEWGARHGRGNTSITPGRGGVTVHYEGGGRLTGGPHSACDNRVRNIESYHVNGNGWAGIAYTALVCEHGYVFEGRGLGHRTAANGTNSGNQNWYAVCALIGDKDPLGADLLRGLRDAIEWCRDGGAARRVNGHRDHLATSCPGDRLYAWVRAGMPAESEEDDVSAGDLWDHRIGVPDYAKDLHPKAKEYAAGGWLRGAEIQARRARIAAEAGNAAIAELSRALGELAADRGQTVDVDALVARIGERLESIKVRLDVEDVEDAS